MQSLFKQTGTDVTGDQMTETELREINNNLNLLMMEMRELNRHLSRIAEKE